MGVWGRCPHAGEAGRSWGATCVGRFPRQCVAEIPSVAATAVDWSRVAGFPARATAVVEPLPWGHCPHTPILPQLMS